MTRKPNYERPIMDIKQGKFAEWPEDAPPSDEVAAAASFTGDPEHKTYSSVAGAGHRKWDKNKCDVYSSDDWELLQDALRSAIRNKCTGAFRGNFPFRAWAYINGTLHEARLTNQDNGEYHGFPLNGEAQFPRPAEYLERAPHVTITIRNHD